MPPKYRTLADVPGLVEAWERHKDTPVWNPLEEYAALRQALAERHEQGEGPPPFRIRLTPVTA